MSYTRSPLPSDTSIADRAPLIPHAPSYYFLAVSFPVFICIFIFATSNTMDNSLSLVLGTFPLESNLDAGNDKILSYQTIQNHLGLI